MLCAGQVKLTDIGFVVPAGLLGLEGLTQHPINPVVLEALLKKHGFCIVEPVAD